MQMFVYLLPLTLSVGGFVFLPFDSHQLPCVKSGALAVIRLKGIAVQGDYVFLHKNIFTFSFDIVFYEKPNFISYFKGEVAMASSFFVNYSNFFPTSFDIITLRGYTILMKTIFFMSKCVIIRFRNTICRGGTV